MRRIPWLVAAVLLAGLLLSGCSKGTVAQWASSMGAGGADYQLVTDAQHLLTGIRLHQFTAVRTACEAFSDDASTADGNLPTPNPTLTDELNTAYQDDYVGGDDCFQATSFDSPKFRTFEHLLAAGSAELAKAEKLLGQLAPGANAATGGSGGSI